MFIMLLFGYKQNRIFTIDCLTATLMDCIWANALKDMQKLLVQKEDLLNRENFSIQKKIANLEKKIEALEKQIKDEENKKNMEIAKDEKKKGAKPPPPAKKKGDPSNPLEKEKVEATAELEKAKENSNKYTEKLAKLKVYKEKYNDLANNTNISLELLDKQGERKFVKGKLDSIATSFISDKGSYYLSLVKENPEEENPLELVNIEGYCLRTLEEDEKATQEEEINILSDKNKKDSKKKAGKK